MKEYATAMIIGKPIAEILNEWATDGWELKFFIPPDGHNMGIIIFERNKSEE